MSLIIILRKLFRNSLTNHYFIKLSKLVESETDLAAPTDHVRVFNFIIT